MSAEITAGEPEVDQGKRRQRRPWVAVVLWAIFAAGLAVQIFGSSLKVEDHAFIVPPSLVSRGKLLRLDELITREQRIQWASAILTVGGAIGLAFLYGEDFFKRRPS